MAAIAYDDGDHRNETGMEIKDETDDAYLVGWLDEANGEWREETIRKAWVNDDRYPYELV